MPDDFPTEESESALGAWPPVSVDTAPAPEGIPGYRPVPSMPLPPPPDMDKRRLEIIQELYNTHQLEEANQALTVAMRWQGARMLENDVAAAQAKGVPLDEAMRAAYLKNGSKLFWQGPNRSPSEVLPNLMNALKPTPQPRMVTLGGRNFAVDAHGNLHPIQPPPGNAAHSLQLVPALTPEGKNSEDYYGVERATGGYSPLRRPPPPKTGLTPQQALAVREKMIHPLEIVSGNFKEKYSPQAVAEAQRIIDEGRKLLGEEEVIQRTEGIKSDWWNPFTKDTPATTNRTIRAIQRPLPVSPAMPPPPPSQGSLSVEPVPLTADKAKEFLAQAKGDKNLARQLARSAGYSF